VRRVRWHHLDAWLVTRYDLARQALTESALSNDRADAHSGTRSAAWLFADEVFDLQHHMLRSNPPRHFRIRRVASPAFSAVKVGALAPRVEQIAEDLVAAFGPRGEAELVSEYAFPLPLLVIMEVLGIPLDDRPQLLAWSDVLSSGTPADRAEIIGTLSALRDYLFRLVNDKRGLRGSGLLDRLISACDEGDITSAELLSSAFQLLQGGHVTTLGFIVNAVHVLLREPGLRQRLGQEPDLVESWLDELLRVEPPMTMATVRFTTRPVRIDDVTIPGGGEAVIVALAAANRDPDQFQDPDLFDPERKSPGHLSFGFGPHHCLGRRLARVEAAVALRVLLTRLPGLTLAADQLRWRPNPHLRRPEQLRVVFDADGFH
jgi:cytochrome P450